MDLDVENINKMIKIHVGPSTRKLMRLTLERLNYFPEHFLIVKKGIPISQKI